MNETAYDEIYLNGSMSICRYLFILTARNKLDVFQVLEEYMNSDYREKMDRGNPLFLNKTPKQILGSLGYKIEHIEEISEEYDECDLEWMADIYTYMQWKYKLTSKEIVSVIKPKDLYYKFNPLHETSISNGVRKLATIYQLKENT